MQNKKKKEQRKLGRTIRYQFFNKVAKKIGANKIATAHNLNDNAETVLLNIIRGSGTSGLKGIEPKREGRFIRPLIETSREDIEEYCLENKLNPKIDKTNEEGIYRRNKIRNDLIPYLKKEFNPNIIKTINRLSELVTEENKYLEEVTQDTFNNICVEKRNNEIILNLKKFNDLELVIKRRVILYTISKAVGNTVGIEKVNIDEIIKLCKNNVGNKFLMPTKKIKILVNKSKIYFITIN